MTKTKLSSLFITFFVYFLASFGIIYLIIRYGFFPPAATWVLPIIITIFSMFVLYKGWQVKKYKDKHSYDIDAIMASKIIILAKSASYIGVCLGGFCLAQVVIFFIYNEALYLQNMILVAFVGFISCVLLTVIGMIVESWCVIDGKDIYGDNNIIDREILSHSY